VTVLAADVTPQAVAELDLVPGSEVSYAVKATEVAVHAAPPLTPRMNGSVSAR
jgi:molybdate transport system ATP-binding protein